MNMVLSVYSKAAFKEYILPSITQIMKLQCEVIIFRYKRI